MSGAPTLVSLARELGVSRQTVSNALHAPHRVNAKTLERVLRRIEESGYRPHVAGQQLRTRRSRSLAMRLHPAADGVNGSILDRFLHALTEAAQRHGYRLVLFTASDDEDETSSIAGLLATANIDGFVLTSTHHDDRRTDWLLERDIPFVAFGRPWCAVGDPFAAPHSWIDVDGGAGTEEATRMLLDQGHRRIGFLGWPEGSGVGDDRRAGWRRALEAAGLGAGSTVLSIGTEDSAGPGAQAARELFGRGATALVCASDSLALGGITAWRERGDLTADSVPVVGFDDTPVAATVGLSSVSQPVEQVAQHVLTLLLRQMKNDSAGLPEHLLLRSSLVVRSPHPALFHRTREGNEGASR